ncbi:hypothetical protein DSCA_30230 [Desulfosarcina alkanivorans]|uniref:SpoVG family protein n=1 Tax=Desulfosarcina alkanivorans TaxID=571177 RepID=A0A5K7YKN7_9BACT|nr:hypothetical protein [Desulfosarcina alkanivorans]BBO69093.1 hypothetical protein DSCA_30230 [Desulfosarcina alkanivorans]
MISALNFKSFDRGAILGFFDLRYHGLTIKDCRLMNTNGGLWIAFPQRQTKQDGETKYFDQMYLTPPETDYVRRMVIAELQAQGHFDRPSGKGSGAKQSNSRPLHRTPEGEDLSEYYTPPGTDDDIPF